MRKPLLTLLTLLFCVSAFKAQDNVFPKANATLAAYLQQRNCAHNSASTTFARSNSYAKQQDSISVLVDASDVDEVLLWLSRRNLRANTVLAQSLTALMPIDSLQSLMALESVQGVNAFNTRTLSLSAARESSNADIAINGTGLYAPYTGKDVIIGIIDQGFLYTHPAFRKADGSSRIIAARRIESGKTHPELTTSAQILAAGNDGLNAIHATSVAGIAAGGRDAINTEYYGVAPDADIIAVPCERLEDAEVIDEINYISSVAKKHNKPFVVNMSFGTQATTHNGKGAFASSIDQLAGPGALLVSAVGNKGDSRVHAKMDFTNSSDSAMIYIPNNGKNITIFICSRDKTPITVNIFKYDTSTSTLTYKTLSYWQQSNSQIVSGTESKSQQPYLYANIDVAAVYPNQTDDNYCIAFSIKGQAGHSADAWICDANHQFAFPLSTDTRFKTNPDNASTISSPADASNVVAATAYTSNNSWISLVDGKTRTGYNLHNNASAYYASIGPLTGGTQVKPTIAAPGSLIITSAYDNNQHYTASSSAKTQLTHQVNYDGQSYYYAISNGTSMASPMVAGALAIWLEANPSLTPQQAMEILRLTSRSDSYTGSTPNNTWGYGKLDIYAGLQQVLLLSPVRSQRNSTQPFSIQQYPNHIAVLLNNDEDYASLRLLSTNGSSVWSTHLNNATRAQEIQIPTSSLQRGIYILKLSSQNSTLTRKIVIE